MASYVEIGGKKVNGSLLALAEKLTNGNGDGRISKADAEVLFHEVTADGVYTDVEKESIAYIRQHFKWTDHADTWFKDEITAWRSSPKMTAVIPLHELGTKQFSKEDVLSTAEAQAARKHDLHTATIETNEDHDEITLIMRLADGQRVAVKSNFIELEGEFVELKGGHIIPVRAIEKVEI